MHKAISHRCPDFLNLWLQQVLRSLCCGIWKSVPSTDTLQLLRFSPFNRFSHLICGAQRWTREKLETKQRRQRESTHTVRLWLCNHFCHERRPLTKCVLMDAEVVCGNFVSGTNLHVVQAMQQVNWTSTWGQIFLKNLCPKDCTMRWFDSTTRAKSVQLCPRVSISSMMVREAQSKLQKVGRLHWELQGRHDCFLVFVESDVVKTTTLNKRALSPHAGKNKNQEWRRRASFAGEKASHPIQRHNCSASLQMLTFDCVAFCLFHGAIMAPFIVARGFCNKMSETTRENP